jgi:flavin reductase (DIM6/NTAB) family NADH-FMN oxidoreductase RutF
MKKWKEVFSQTDINEFNAQVFNLIGNEWFLLTAGSKDNFNTMTASWGTLGVLWNKPIATCFIRPTRHTFSFADENDVFTLSFFPEEFRKILNFCGSKSGRETDKIKETGLLPIVSERGGISYEQAKLVIECKKIYFDDLKPIFMIPEEIDEKNYPNKDYHRMFIGEIVSINKKAR